MISRLTDLPSENARPTVEPHRMVEIACHDEGRLSDVAPVGYAGASFYPEDGLLILTYQKFGETYADPDDEENPVEYADTGLGFLTVEKVAELVEKMLEINAPWNRDQCRDWVLEQIEHP
jgi:hypothetical protein